MSRLVIVLGLFIAAATCALALLLISNATVVPMVASGTGPDGVQVTSGGWLALGLSLFGTGGFTVAGVVTALVSRLGFHLPQGTAENAAAEVVELTESFASLMSDKSSRAAQRRFFFALVDAARLINGCETSHDGGVIIVKYSGYADPVAPSTQGAKP